MREPLGSWADVPTFGSPRRDHPAVARPSAYALVTDADGRIAVVRTPKGIFLPGGGIDPGESARDAMIREVLEECGLPVQPGSWSDVAKDFVDSPEESTHFEKRCTFFDARVAGEPGTAHESDHELQWLAPSDAIERLTRASHRWAVSRWLGSSRSTAMPNG